MLTVNKRILERYHYRKIIVLIRPLLFENNSNVDQNWKIDTTPLFQRVGNDNTDICNVLHENNTNAIEKIKNDPVPPSKEAHSVYAAICTLLHKHLEIIQDIYKIKATPVSRQDKMAMAKYSFGCFQNNTSGYI